MVTAFLTLMRSMGKMKVISAMWWRLIVQSNRGGVSEGTVGKGFVCQAGPFSGFGKVSDGPKPLVHCSDITSAFLIHVVGVRMLASVG